MSDWIGPIIAGFGTSFFLSAMGIETFSKSWWAYVAALMFVYALGLIEGALRF